MTVSALIFFTLLAQSGTNPVNLVLDPNSKITDNNTSDLISDALKEHRETTGEQIVFVIASPSQYEALKDETDPVQAKITLGIDPGEIQKGWVAGNSAFLIWNKDLTEVHAILSDAMLAKTTLSQTDFETELEEAISKSHSSNERLRQSLEIVLKLLKSPLIEFERLDELDEKYPVSSHSMKESTPTPHYVFWLIIGVFSLGITTAILTGSDTHFDVQGRRRVRPLQKIKESILSTPTQDVETINGKW